MTYVQLLFDRNYSASLFSLSIIEISNLLRCSFTQKKAKPAGILPIVLSEKRFDTNLS